MPAENDLRPSPIAGQWYPGDARRLADSVDGYLHSAHLPPLEGQVLGVIAPHAGHVYSGPVAGFAFAAVYGLKPELVAVIAPMHYPSAYPYLTTAHQAYLTPLGPVPVDRETLTALDDFLEAELGLGVVPVRRDPEHSLEIQLPFLQRALGSPFLLLPVMIHHPDPGLARALGRGLARVVSGREALLVASSDLSHFYTQAEAAVYDAEFLRQLEALDPEGVLRVEEEGRGFACGRGAVAAVLWAALELGAASAQILHYATSGEISGDFNRVVGYAAAALTRPAPGLDRRN
jgi:AmmeMemoRadiSam system protein B